MRRGIRKEPLDGSQLGGLDLRVLCKVLAAGTCSKPNVVEVLIRLSGLVRWLYALH